MKLSDILAKECEGNPDPMLDPDWVEDVRMLEAENIRLREALEAMLDEDDGGRSAEQARAALENHHAG